MSSSDRTARALRRAPEPAGGSRSRSACTPRRRWVFRAALASALAAGLAGCGFHIRGDTPLPFKSMAIVGADGSSLVVDLRRTLRGNAKVAIVDRPDQAEVTLYIVSNTNDKSILTLSGGGRVREFQLSQKLVFRVANGAGVEWLPLSEINVRRDFSFNDSQAIAKEGEERLLLADMQADVVQQLIRRLSLAKAPAQG
jgi:LPS-assembly lipoprotein